MIIKTKKAILFGTSGQTQVMDFLLTVDSEYEIVAFENIEELFPANQFEMHIAIGYNSQNTMRAKFYDLAKAKGYKLLTYISSRCTNYSKSIGDNCFIFEDNTIQPFVEIGNNCILWSGNHIGHHSIIQANVFISSQVVISGHCTIGNNAFLGVNSTLRDGIKIAPYTTLGAGCLIVRDTEENKTYIGTKATEYPDRK